MRGCAGTKSRVGRPIFPQQPPALCVGNNLWLCPFPFQMRRHDQALKHASHGVQVVCETGDRPAQTGELALKCGALDRQLALALRAFNCDHQKGCCNKQALTFCYAATLPSLSRNRLASGAHTQVPAVGHHHRGRAAGVDIQEAAVLRMSQLAGWLALTG